MSHHEEYPLFVHYYQSLHWIMDTVERFPRSARFTLGDRLVNSGLNVVEHIVEAIYTRDRGPLLSSVNRELERQRVLFRIAHDRRYLSIAQLEHIAKALDEAGRMTGGWLKDTREKTRPSV
jgi:hypothetical protein